MNARPHVVVVDDEADLREPIVDYLRDEGLDVTGVDGGAALDGLLATRRLDVAVLDINMPGEDGLSIARRLRAAGPIGLIFLTAKRDLVDRVAGLELGADDYVTKPFEPRELLARIRSVLRRVETNPVPQASAYGSTLQVGATGGGSRTVALSEVEWIEAAKDYLILHTAKRSHMLRGTMAGLERDLDPAQFVRIHRSAFVNRAAIGSIARRGERAQVITKGGAIIAVGPSFTGIVGRLLSDA